MFLKNNNGIILDQVKEPAFSRDLLPFLSSSPQGANSWAPVEDIESLSLKQVMDLAQRAGIIDENNSKPLAERLKKWAKTPPTAVVGDAIDDEPYVSSQVNPLLKLSQEAAGGLRILQKALGAPKAYFAVYKEMYDLNTKVPSKVESFPVVKIGGRYPMEQRAISRLGRDTLLLGCGALIHLYRAAVKGQPQTTCFVTVAGNCIGNPANLEVTIGTTVAQVLERCGLIQDPTYIVSGGAMKGKPVLEPENTIIQVGTRAVLAFRENRKERQYTCIGCGRCLEVCPSGLNPALLYQALRDRRGVTAQKLGLSRCIGCSTCSYICPSKLDLSYTIFEANIKKKRGEENE